MRDQYEVFVDPKSFVAASKKRGLELEAPVEKSALARFETLIAGEAFAPVFEGFYSVFGGYASHDNENHIDLWPLEKIAEQLSLATIIDGKKFWAIGDFLMHSDFIGADLRDDRSPIFLLAERRIFSASISQFALELTSGKFDF
jgi:hypothetical protein